MNKQLLVKLLAIAFAILIPVMVFASSSDDEGGDGIDARLKGYKDGTMALKDASGTALVWVLILILGALCVGVLFMNAKRTHLD